MRHRFRNLAAILLVALPAFVYTGCKEDTIIKANVAPGSNILTTDSIYTLPIITKSAYIDTLNTSKLITDYPVIQGLGTIVDPYFGRTNAFMYFQVLPTVNSFSFSSNSYEIDSAMLILPYVYFGWGDRTNPKPQTFRVYEVTTKMSIDETYYSNQKLDVDRNTPLSDPYTADLKQLLNTDSVFIVDRNVGYKHLRIPLKKDFYDRINGQVGTSTFDNEENFLNYFKGICIEPTDTSSSDANFLPYFFLDGTENYARGAIAFYYHETGDPTVKTAFFNFVRGKTAQYNRLTRNYNYPSTTPVKMLLDSYTQNPDVTDSIVVLQNEPGAAIDIRVPNIQTIPDAAIVKAQIIITQVSSGFAIDSLPSPSRLNIKGIDATGTPYDVEDYNSTNITGANSFIDGTRSYETDGNGKDVTKYRINIPRELQKAIRDGKNELHLRITGIKGYPGAYRLVAGGSTHSSNKLELQIVYSKPN